MIPALREDISVPAEELGGIVIIYWIGSFIHSWFWMAFTFKTNVEDHACLSGYVLSCEFHQFSFYFKRLRNNSVRVYLAESLPFLQDLLLSRFAIVGFS